MVCTLHLRPDTFASPNVISLFTVALEAVALFPIIVLPSPLVVVDPALLPKKELAFPVTSLEVFEPIEVLFDPVASSWQLTPMAILLLLVWLSLAELWPIAILKLPVVLLLPADVPKPQLLVPVVLLINDSWPTVEL